jgi:UDP-glucose 4-epimerase
MSAERCLVLGGSGFMGSHLVELLVEQGFQVRTYSRSPTLPDRLASVQKRIELVTGDFSNAKVLANSVRGCDYVYHLIATTKPATSNRDVVFDSETNLVSTLRLLETCLREKVRKVIFASSGGTIYGSTDSAPIRETHPTEPQSSYGITKLAIEKYLELFHRLHGLDYTVLRIGNCYGPRLPIEGGQGAVGAFLERLRCGRPLVLWGDGLVRRDYVYVGDVAQAFWAALGQQSEFRVFNIGTGLGTSLLELIELMEDVTGCQAHILKESTRPIDVPVNILDPTRAHRYLNWQASTALETGLLSTWNWIRAVAHGSDESVHRCSFPGQSTTNLPWKSSVRNGPGREGDKS